jgi:hypothetical protein
MSGGERGGSSRLPGAELVKKGSLTPQKTPKHPPAPSSLVPLSPKPPAKRDGK